MARGNRPGQGQGQQQGEQGEQTAQGGKEQGQGGKASQGGQHGGHSPTGEASLAEVYKDIWGHLPEALRNEMNAYSREEFMDKYKDQLKQFYATIAEKGRRKN
jgi:hypothetical protein